MRLESNDCDGVAALEQTRFRQARRSGSSPAGAPAGIWCNEGVPLQYSVDHANRRVRQTASDPLTADDILMGQGRQATDGAWSYATLIDMRHVTWVPSKDDLRRFVAHIETLRQTHGIRGPVATVARSNSMLYGVACTYAVLAERTGTRIETFTELADAESWLSRQS